MIHEKGYWTSSDETDTHVFDESLSNAIIDEFKNKITTVVDIGCGNGKYTMNFNNNGINCVGFDGNPLTPLLTNNICKVKDFSELVNIGQFDLVLSLEVGEHIPIQYEQNFINNLCTSSIKYIIISWAIEGQGGDGHVNCRNNEYIINQMVGRFFKYDAELTKFLRNKSTLLWFKNTIMAFEK